MVSHGNTVAPGKNRTPEIQTLKLPSINFGLIHVIFLLSRGYILQKPFSPVVRAIKNQCLAGTYISGSNIMGKSGIGTTVGIVWGSYA